MPADELSLLMELEAELRNSRNNKHRRLTRVLRQLNDLREYGSAPITSEIQTLKEKLKTTLDMLEHLRISREDVSSHGVDEWIDGCRKAYPEFGND